MAAHPAIVIPAFARPAALQRLLDSLDQAAYPEAEIVLVISLEGGAAEAVHVVAEGFQWRFGPKEIQIQPERLGLRKHIYHCAGLSERFGAVVMLEDDILVGRSFYRYACHVWARVAAQAQVAGQALYRYQRPESVDLPFQVPGTVADFYMQVPCSWGQLFTAAQWNRFLAWDRQAVDTQIDALIPAYMSTWGAESWKRRFTAYMVDQGLYFHYPAHGHSTNPGLAGTHSRSSYESALDGPAEPDLLPLDGHPAVFDAYFELLPSCLKEATGKWPDMDLCVDFFGQKPLTEISKHAWVLTTKQMQGASEGFGLDRMPYWENIRMAERGDAVFLGRSEQAGALFSLPRVNRRLPGITRKRVSLVVWGEKEPQNIGAKTALLDADCLLDWVILVDGKGHLPVHPRMQMVVVEGLNPELAILKGLSHAQGDYIACVERVDDWAAGLADHLCACWEAFPSHGFAMVDRQTGKDGHPQPDVRWDFMKWGQSGHHRKEAAFQPHKLVWRGDYLQACLEENPQGLLDLAAAGLSKGRMVTIPFPWAEKQGNLVPLTAATYNIQRPGWGSRALLAKLTVFAYAKNWPILRQVHLNAADYGPVLRLSDSGDVFESAY